MLPGDGQGSERRAKHKRQDHAENREGAKDRLPEGPSNPAHDALTLPSQPPKVNAKAYPWKRRSRGPGCRTTHARPFQEGEVHEAHGKKADGLTRLVGTFFGKVEGPCRAKARGSA